MDPNQPSCSRDATQGGDAEPPAKRRLYTEEVLLMWNLARIVRELWSREQGVEFAVQHGLVASSMECRVHRTPMNIDYWANNTVGQFYCSKSSCRGKTRKSRTSGTWLENVKIPLLHVYYLMYCYAHCWAHEMVIHEDPLRNDKEKCLSPNTISDWYSHCREVVVSYQLDQEQEKGKIGGPGKVVHLYESKFGKRKYNKGRRVEGHWIIGIIEEGSEDLRLEVRPDNVRSAEVLIPLIQKHVEVGTTIHTDTDHWTAYDCLDQYGYIHKKVNHSDPDNPLAEDRTHKQNKESQWRVVKRFFYKNNYNHSENVADAVVEYLWRSKNMKYKKDPFMELIKVVKYVYNRE